MLHIPVASFLYGVKISSTIFIDMKWKPRQIASIQRIIDFTRHAGYFYIGTYLPEELF